MNNSELPSPVFNACMRHPFTAIITGPPKSGKSVFCKDLILNINRIIDPTPTNIVWFYGQKTKTIEQISALPNVITIQGIPKADELEEFKGTYEHPHSLFIFDDLQTEASANTDIGQLFSRQSHHESISVILILQDLFYNGRERKSIMRSTHYLILFHNPLDYGPIHNLARRIMPNSPKTLINIAMFIFMRSPHSYLFIDGSQETETNARFRTDIFNVVQRVFIPTINYK